MSNDVLNISVFGLFCIFVPFAIWCLIEDIRLSRSKRLLFEKSLKRIEK